VVCEAINFDGEPGRGPVAVHLDAMEQHVHLGLRQAGSSNEVEHEIFGLRARVRRQCVPLHEMAQAPGAGTAGMTIQEPAQLVEPEEVHAHCIRKRFLEHPRCRDHAQVDQRARRRGDRYAIEPRHFIGNQLASVGADARPPARAHRRPEGEVHHVPVALRIEALPEGRGRQVTGGRARAREDRRHFAGPRRDHRPHAVDAAMKRVEQTRFRATVHCIPRHTRALELTTRHDAVLLRRELGDHALGPPTRRSVD
jgi:hypothetical protein